MPRFHLRLSNRRRRKFRLIDSTVFLLADAISNRRLANSSLDMGPPCPSTTLRVPLLPDSCEQSTEVEVRSRGSSTTPGRHKSRSVSGLNVERYRFRSEPAFPPVMSLSGAVYCPREPPNRAGLLRDASGSVYEPSVFRRGKMGRAVYPNEAMAESGTRHLPLQRGSWTYVGHLLVPHFGHFLTEGLSRFWFPALKQIDESPLLYHGPPNIARIGFVQEILTSLGIDPDRLVSFDDPVRLEEVVVPEVSFIIRGMVSDAHRLLGDRVREGFGLTTEAPERGTKGVSAYLSRSRLLGARRRLAGERELERQLSTRAVSILHPQEMSVREQIQHMDECDSLIGPLGSAHHTTLFLGGTRRHVYLSDRLRTNYVMIDHLMGNQPTYLNVVQSLRSRGRQRDLVLPHDILTLLADIV